MTESKKITQTENTPRPHPYKCPKHNTWMRKGHCEPCRMAEVAKEKAMHAALGIIKQPIKIGKL